MMSRRWYIGISTGSSITGVDAALVRIEGTGLTLVPHLERFVHEPYTRDLRDLLLRVGNAPALHQIGLAHRVLGEKFANVARKLVDQTRLTWQQILGIGISGHTAWQDADGRYPCTLNLGMPAALAERTGLTVLSDFRSRDILVGGQGDPVTSIVDALLYRDSQERRLLIHLGGVSSVVWLPPDAAQRGIVGFHAAPCAMLLDGLMGLLTGGRESFDAGGKNAVQGRCIEPLVQRWLAHPFFKRKPPRILPCREFGPEFQAEAVELAKQHGGNLHDLLCTATHFAARATVESVQEFIPATPDRVLVSGGGARNGLLWRLLEQQFAPIPMERVDCFGVPAEARKAVSFACLAALTMDGIPANVPGTTGAAGPRLLGSVTPGDGVNWARCLAWMASQTAHQRLAA